MLRVRKRWARGVVGDMEMMFVSEVSTRKKKRLSYGYVQEELFVHIAQKMSSRRISCFRSDNRLERLARLVQFIETCQLCCIEMLEQGCLNSIINPLLLKRKKYVKWNRDWLTSRVASDMAVDSKN